MKNWNFEKDRPITGVCAPSPTVPLDEPPYPEATRLFGSYNVEHALEFIDGIVHPVTSNAIRIPSDDQSLTDVLTAAFSALKREELNSEGFEEKLADAIETILYTFKMPVILQVTGNYTVYDPEAGNEPFSGSHRDLICWVRDKETVLIDEPSDEGGARL